MLDLLLKEGKVVDGSGNPWYIADIGIKGDRIEKIGRVEEKAHEVIDCRGKVVAPGFIDAHTHCDGLVLIDPSLKWYAHQGVTTLIIGNCSISAFPDYESFKMSATYSPFAGMFSPSRITVKWSSLSEYRARLQERAIALNVAPLIGHGTIRTALGLTEKRKLDDKDIIELRRLVEKGMKEGAFGLSFGLSYSPSRYADLNELIKLSEMIKMYSGIVAFHLRGIGWLNGLKEAIEVSKRAGVKAQISHLQGPGTYSTNGPSLLSIVNGARKEGLDVAFDVIPFHEFPVRSDQWAATAHIIARQFGGELAPQNFHEFIKALSERELRQKIERLYIQHIGDVADYFYVYTVSDAEHLIVTNLRPEGIKGKTIRELADIKGVDPLTMFFNIIFDVEHPSILTLNLGSSQTNFDALFHPLGMPCSDLIPDIDDPMACPVPTACGTFPYFFRNAIAKGMPMEEAVRKMSSLPASRFGILDRGFLIKGMKADIVVLDPNEYKNRASVKDPLALASGVNFLVVNGKLLIRDGKMTDERSGEVLSFKAS